MPRSTQEFINSIGVNLHLGYTDTVHYSKWDTWKNYLFDSGIKHIRETVPSAYLGTKAYARDRLAEMGRHGIILMGGIVPSIDLNIFLKDWEQLQREGTDIKMDSIQLGNEPDVFWVPGRDNYKGKYYPDGYRMFIEDYGKALKSSPVVKGMDIIGAAIVKNYDEKAYAGESFAPFVTQGFRPCLFRRWSVRLQPQPVLWRFEPMAGRLPHLIHLSEQQQYRSLQLCGPSCPFL